MEQKKPKVKLKRIANIIANVLTAVVVLFAVTVAVSSIASKGKGYVNILGYAYLSVASASMTGDHKDSFDEGDIIRIKILNESQKTECKVGQIITFWDDHISSNKKELNSHRIIEVLRDGDKVSYRTQGDYNIDPDPYERTSEDVVGVYKGKANGVGSVMQWTQTKNGFLVCVVIPSGIVLIYALAMMVLNVVQYNKKKLLAESQDKEAEFKAQMEVEIREKILKEIQDKSGNGGNTQG